MIVPLIVQPKLNEQPVVESAGKKRPANDENLEPVSNVPPAKQPRTIDINLPNRWEDFASSETTTKGTAVSVTESTHRNTRTYIFKITLPALYMQRIDKSRASRPRKRQEMQRIVPKQAVNCSNRPPPLAQQQSRETQPQRQRLPVHTQVLWSML